MYKKHFCYFICLIFFLPLFSQLVSWERLLETVKMWDEGKPRLEDEERNREKVP